MKTLVLNHKQVILILVTVLLTYGAHGTSYGDVCKVGDILSPGESCTYPGTDIEFSVLNDGSGRFLFFTAGTGINARNVTINGVRYNFAASKQADGTWLIEAAGDGGTTPPPPAQKPDLVVGQPTVSKSTLAPGENFTLSATVKNQGTGGAAATTLRYYRSTNATISTIDMEVGTDSVNALGKNRSGAESITLTASTSPGTYYYGACVEEVTGESSSDNNCSTAVSITVEQATDPTAPAGEATYESGADIPTLPTGFWTPDLLSGGASYLFSGGQITMEFNNGGLIEEGGITYTCVAAGGCRIEGRRVTQGTIQVSGGGQSPPPVVQQPDLVVEAVEAVPATVEPGQEFRLYATLRNRGTAESAATRVRYYRSTNSIISTEDTQLGTGRRDPLAANATVRRYLSVTAPSSAGVYYYGVCVDSVNNESNTTNNCSVAVSVTVGAPLSVGPEPYLSIYWTDLGTDKIQRANLDGSNIEDLVTTGLEIPVGIALDVAGGKMYWVDWGTEKIQRANLDGSNVEDLVTTGLETPVGIALDVAGGKMYWADWDTGKIQCANLDGSNIEDLITGLEVPNDITLNVAGGKMYWTDNGTGKIQCANLDGSNIEDLVTRTQGLGNPAGIAIGILSPVNPIIVREDVNLDGVVDTNDLVYISQRYGRTGQIPGDVNDDGIINIDDLILVAAVIDSASAAPSVRSQLPKDLTAATVTQWLTEAKLTGDKTPRYQRGILVLEQLLAALTPKETVLLPNYPNPFNPETWIPYHLSTDADVTLTIYDTQGVLVRELDLGHQRAGYYTDRSRAAYWDGRNALGEGVASGVYFYQLRVSSSRSIGAGDYSQMRKMVILK